MSDSIITSAAARKVVYVLAVLWNLAYGAFTLLNAFYGWFSVEEVAVWGTAASVIFNSPALGLAAANARSGLVAIEGSTYEAGPVTFYPEGNFVTDSAGTWNAEDIGDPTPAGE